TLMPSTLLTGPRAQIVVREQLEALLTGGLPTSAAELLTVKADDVQGRELLYQMVHSKEKQLHPDSPASARRLAAVLQAACFTSEVPLRVSSTDPADVPKLPAVRDSFQVSLASPH